MSRRMNRFFILVALICLPKVVLAQNYYDAEQTEALAKIWEDYKRTGQIIIPNSLKEQESTQQSNYQQQQNYSGYNTDGNNYVNQTTSSQDYQKTSSVNGVSAEGMIDNSGYSSYSSSSSSTTTRSSNNSRMRRDINAESRAKSSAQSNPTGASLSRARTYERNNNIKYGRGR